MPYSTPYKASSLLALPLEIFQLILYEALLARSNGRGLKLRLVNRFFSNQVQYLHFLHNMLDVSLSKAYPKPPFTASYLEHRVNNEPDDGNSRLLCIRRVAENLTVSQPHATKNYVSSLCSLAVPNMEWIFDSAYGESDDEIEYHLAAAEVYMNHLSAVRAWRPQPRRRSRLFGDAAILAIQFGSQEMVQAARFEGPRIGEPLRRLGRCHAIWRAAKYGRPDIFRFCFNYRIDERPWTFDAKRIFPNESRYLDKALSTPSPEIWDYVMALHKEYGLTLRTRHHATRLSACARMGWTDMAKHLLQHGVDPNDWIHEDESHIFYAAKHGRHEILNILLAYGARITAHTLAGAASTGHLEIVKHLLTLNTATNGALVAAAKGGYGDVVDVLLDNGADPNEKYDDLPALGYAVLHEHTRMFHCLRKAGANPLEPSAKALCEEMSRAKGVELMLELLDREWRD